MTYAYRLLSWVLLLTVSHVAVGHAADDKGKKLAPVRAELETEHLFPDGRRIFVTGRYFRTADGRTREEQGNMVTIADITKRKMTILNSATKEAIHFTFDEADGDAGPVPAEAATPASREGDSVGSYESLPVRKQAVDHGDSRREVWTAPSIGLIVYGRMVSPQMTTTKRLKNIAVEPPLEALFGVPAGYSVKEHRVPRPQSKVK